MKDIDEFLNNNKIDCDIFKKDKGENEDENVVGENKELLGSQRTKASDEGSRKNNSLEDYEDSEIFIFESNFENIETSKEDFSEVSNSDNSSFESDGDNNKKIDSSPEFRNREDFREDREIIEEGMENNDNDLMETNNNDSENISEYLVENNEIENSSEPIFNNEEEKITKEKFMEEIEKEQKEAKIKEENSYAEIVNSRFSSDLLNYRNIREYILSKQFLPYKENVLKMIKFKYNFYLDNEIKINFLNECLSKSYADKSFIDNRVEELADILDLYENDEGSIIKKYIVVYLIEFENDIKFSIMNETKMSIWDNTRRHIQKNNYFNISEEQLQNLLTGEEFQNYIEMNSVIDNRNKLNRKTKISPEYIFELGHQVRNPDNSEYDILDSFVPEDEDLTEIYKKSYIHSILETIYSNIKYSQKEFMEYAIGSPKVICSAKTYYKYVIDFQIGIRLVYFDPYKPNTRNININPYIISNNIPFSFKNKLQITIPVYSPHLRCSPEPWADTFIKYVEYLGGAVPEQRKIKIGNYFPMMVLEEKVYNNPICQKFENGIQGTKKNSLNPSPRFFVHSNTIYTKLYSTKNRQFVNIIIGTVKFFVDTRRMNEENGYVDIIVSNYNELICTYIIDLLDIIMGSLVKFFDENYGSQGVGLRIKFEIHKDNFTPLSLYSRIVGAESFNDNEEKYTEFIKYHLSSNPELYVNQTDYFIQDFSKIDEQPRKRGIIDHRIFANYKLVADLVGRFFRSIENNLPTKTDEKKYITEVKKLLGLKEIFVPATEIFEASPIYIDKIKNSIYRSKIINIPNEEILNSNSLDNDTSIAIERYMHELRDMPDSIRKNVNTSFGDSLSNMVRNLTEK